MKKAVYAGSFDPITNGHLWMIEQGARLFDVLVVAIGVNPDKSYTFSLQERMAMIEQATSTLPQITVDSFDQQFLVDFAYTVDAQYILRGIRNEADYAFERGMRHINEDLRAEIITVFMMPPREMAEVSSSFVRGLIGPKGWERVIQRYVPEATYQFLLQKFR
jgi:pantetheine-phosphate adenylyltransferase